MCELSLDLTLEHELDPPIQLAEQSQDSGVDNWR